MNKVFLVAWREFVATVATRAFVLGVVLPPVIMAVVIMVMPVLMNKAAPSVRGHIALIDQSGSVTKSLEAAYSPEAVQARREARMKKAAKDAPIPEPLKQQAEKQMELAAAALGGSKVTLQVLDAAADIEAAKAPIKKATGKEDKDAQGDPRLALVVVPKEVVTGKPDKSFEQYRIFTAPRLDVEWSNDIEREVNKAVVNARLDTGGFSVDEVRRLIQPPQSETSAVTADGDRKSSEVASLLVPGAFLFLLWISVFTCGQYLLTSTIEEKSSRVMEVLLSAVSPMQLMTGKILGQMGVGALILLAYGGLGMGGLVFASMMHLIDPMNLVYLAIYFIIAFALIAALMAAVGSAVSDIREAQSLMGPIMIVLIIPMILWMPILRNPNSLFAQICSFVPPISPFIMVLRLAGSEKVPTWQIPASIVFGFVSVFIALWAAAKVFRIGVLMYGKPPSFKVLFKWIRMA